MLRGNVLAGGLIVLAGLSAACAAAMLPPGRVPITADVKVTATCESAGSVAVTVDPPSVTIHPGDTVTWTLLGSATQLVITPKIKGRFFPPRKAHWPFPGYPHRGAASVPANAGPARTKAKEDTYRYEVEVTCRISDTESITVTIDPDVIITF